VPSLIQKVLLQLDPERAHHVAQQLIRLRYAACFPSTIIDKPFNVFGLTFRNRVGLAAGWDKNADCIDALFRMGFGFVEVGTVTPKPQAGNPKPRLFRIPEKNALINRMGFNNAGVDALVEKLKVRKEPGIIGVNIGKNKDTELDYAVADYETVLKAVYPYANYVVINISSPNTPGLRELQSERYLPDLLQQLQQTKKNLEVQFKKSVPLLVKTTVDLPQASRASFVRVLLDNHIGGVVISNTTIDHSSVLDSRHSNEAGGLSGVPLRVRTTEMIAQFHALSEKQLPIIGVGGILSAEDAQQHYDAGASLVQIFTGLVYRGPKLIREIATL
jgi:dihydroorotate dehydrogenase